VTCSSGAASRPHSAASVANAADETASSASVEPSPAAAASRSTKTRLPRLSTPRRARMSSARSATLTPSPVRACAVACHSAASSTPLMVMRPDWLR
jgi:hypothetical protein